MDNLVEAKLPHYHHWAALVLTIGTSTLTEWLGTTTTIPFALTTFTRGNQSTQEGEVLHANLFFFTLHNSVVGISIACAQLSIMAVTPLACREYC